jgi:hypothetical protein
MRAHGRTGRDRQCAAHTAVDKAESEPELARTLNTLAPGVLAEEASRLGAWLLHYSTDYVFDGSGERPWQESDPTAPLSVYGQTKLAGEHAVAACAKHLIFRTSWVYAARGNNFARTMLRLASERDQLKVIADQIGAPTGAELLADVTAHAIRSAGNNQRSPASTIWWLAARPAGMATPGTSSTSPGKPARPSASRRQPSRRCQAAPTPCPPHARTTPAWTRASCRRPSICACPTGRSAWTACSSKFSGNEPSTSLLATERL